MSLDGALSMIEKTIPAATHGRYLTIPAGGAARLLVGFHGYGEAAEAQLERLRAVEGSDRWTIVSIQGLHRYYQRRTNEVVASWMTRQDRELAIADNLAYVATVVDGEAGSASDIVYAGFSQGVAMAFRAACASTRRVAGVIAAGGDVPPELDRARLSTLGRVLLCRGARDDWYTPEKFSQDCDRLVAAGVLLTRIEFDGAHEWNAAVLAAAAQFLDGASHD